MTLRKPMTMWPWTLSCHEERTGTLVPNWFAEPTCTKKETGPKRSAMKTQLTQIMRPLTECTTGMCWISVRALHVSVKKHPNPFPCCLFRCLEYVLEEIEHSRTANIMVATHNEDTVKFTLEKYVLSPAWNLNYAHLVHISNVVTAKSSSFLRI